MSAYGEVIKAQGVGRIMAAQLMARFPAGMYSLGFLLHLEQVHDSYAAAGLVLAAVSIGQAIAGPLTTRWMGRFGTRIVLTVTLLVCTSSILAVALVPMSLGFHTLIGFIAGISMPPILPAVRTLYPKMVPQKLLAPLFSLDASLQEVIWVIGPVVITFISTQVGTVEGLLVAAIFQVGGGAWFILSPEIGRLRIPPSTRKVGRVLKKAPVLLVVFSGLMLIGGWAAAEAGVVAVFGHDGPEAGIVLSVSAIGSLLGGLALGHRKISRFSLSIRLAIVFAGFLVALFLPTFWGLCLAMFVAGIGTAPALSAMSAIVAATVKFADTPEAYGWVGTGQLIGAALGSAVAGIFIDQQGGTGGILIATVLMCGGAVFALVFRRHQPDLSDGITEPPDTTPIELPR